MSALIEKAVEKLAQRLPEGFARMARFEITDEGAIVVDSQGVRLAGPDDTAADVTLAADAATFRGLLEGRVNPMTAFMTGKLKIDGPMPLAMQLGKAMA